VGGSKRIRSRSPMALETLTTLNLKDRQNGETVGPTTTIEENAVALGKERGGVDATSDDL
jgi:hypothetical protein